MKLDGGGDGIRAWMVIMTCGGGGGERGGGWR